MRHNLYIPYGHSRQQPSTSLSSYASTHATSSATYFGTRDELDITVKRFYADFRAAARSVDRQEVMPSTLRANLDVESIRSDNAGELTSHTYHYLHVLDSESTRFEYTPAYTKDPNGIAERYIGMVFRLVRSMLYAASAPLSFWDSCALNAIDVLNRVLHITSNSTADPGKTAHELLTQKMSDPGSNPGGVRFWDVCVADIQCPSQKMSVPGSNPGGGSILGCLCC